MCCVVSVNARLNVNVALNRPSYQVSTYQDAGGVYYARYANDGNHDTHMANGPCMHTNMATNPWWVVDLGVALYVAGVKYTSRADCGHCGILCLFVADSMRTGSKQAS